MIMDATLLFVRHAHTVLFGSLLLEYLGLPIPGEFVLLLAGALVSWGHLNLWAALGLATLAVLLGEHVWYFAGRHGGQRWLHQFCRLTLGSRQCVARTEEFFQRFGPASLLFAKFIPGFRIFAAPLAGMTRLRYRSFLLFEVLGTVLWVAALILAGVWAGPQLETAVAQLGAFTRLVWMVLVALVLTVLALRLRARRKHGAPLPWPGVAAEDESYPIP
jgi:membrane protein DedA with SNARE-associated domain